ncbi:MAG: AmmeMemoRadiSam system protein B [Deltaproteobacteria bacterium]|nr:AmmeMemoRadiSam system protein B [Deltaproteobacteria bacterium]
MRRAAVAGMFYDSNPGRLTEGIKKYLKNAHPGSVEGDIIALISPHAAHEYSGQAAAFGYKLLDKNKIKRAVILAPTHYVGFRGVSILDVDAYETPLGLVKLDRGTCDMLRKESLFTLVPEAHSREHSLEVQLPFLQVCLGDDFTLVPMIVGQLHNRDHQVIAKSLTKVLKRGDVVIVSSDFTHQGPRFGYVPYKKDIRENIKKLDMGAVDFILEKNSRKFIDYVKDTGATICGRCPIGILLELLPTDANGTLLTYYTSGDITGDERETVSYVSLVFGSPSGWSEKE